MLQKHISRSSLPESLPTLSREQKDLKPMKGSEVEAGWLVVCRAVRWLRKLKIIGKYKNVLPEENTTSDKYSGNLGKWNFGPNYSEESLLVSWDRLFVIWLLGWIPIRKDNKVGDEKQWKLSPSFRTDSYPGLLTSQEGRGELRGRKIIKDRKISVGLAELELSYNSHFSRWLDNDLRF